MISTLLKMRNFNFSIVFFVLIYFVGYAQNPGASYCGSYELSDPIVLNDVHNMVISGLEITNPNGNSIEITNCSNITIKECLLRDSSGNGVNILNSNNIFITDCKINSVATGVYAIQSSTIQVYNNTVKNVLGPFPRGQLAQFNGVTGTGNKINYNTIENILGESNAEDAINIFNSNGTESDSIEIIGNWIRGGGPSASGGGILLGDAGGSYALVKDNILVNPGQYGIGVASGDNITVTNNLIYSKQQDFTNVGLYVWNQYETSCSNITVSGNQVNWTNKEGSLNPAWNSDNCGVVDGWQDNNWRANIDATILPEELTANCAILSNPATELAIKKIALYPNPTKDKITIKFEDPQEKGTIEILSITGQLLQKKHFLNTSFLELKMNQPSGVYIIKITDSDYETNFIRIVKQ